MDFLTPAEGLWALFASAFISATIMPGGSEVLLVALVHAYPEEGVRALAVASLGNTLGAMTSYGIGRLFPNKVQGRAVVWCRKYGAWALFFSWVPVVGDALAVAGGWLRIGWVKSLLILAAGKTARYAVILAGYFQFY